MNKLLLPAALLFGLGTAHAEAPISFSSVTLNYLQSEADQADGDGFGIGVNFSFLKSFYATAEYTTRELEDNGIDNDVDFLSVGAGAFYPLVESGKYVVFGGVTYERVDISGGGASGGGEEGGGEEEGGDGELTGTPLDILLCILPICSAPPTKAFGADGTGDSGGYGAQIGIRAEVYPNVEAALRYQYRVYSDEFPNGDDNESIIGVNLAYRFGQWAAVLNYDSYDTFDIDEYYVGVRYDFGRE